MIVAFAELLSVLQEITPLIQWMTVMENVSSMSDSARDSITEILSQNGTSFVPYKIDAGSVGHIHRPRFYWVSRSLDMVGMNCQWRNGHVEVTRGEEFRLDVSQFLDPGCIKISDKPLPTAVQHTPRSHPMPDPAGIEDCEEDAIARLIGRDAERTWPRHRSLSAAAQHVTMAFP